MNYVPTDYTKTVSESQSPATKSKTALDVAFFYTFLGISRFALNDFGPYYMGRYIKRAVFVAHPVPELYQLYRYIVPTIPIIPYQVYQ